MNAKVAVNQLDLFLSRARKAHQSITNDAEGLRHALDAGDNLIAAKALCAHGEWTERLAATGIPASTAQLYMQLARQRERIEAAGCTSIRQARRLLADRPPRPRKPRPGGSGREGADRYAEGYADGYRAGRADNATVRERPRDANAPSDKDLLWLLKLAHPDKHPGDKEVLVATRVSQWLNGLRG